MEKPFLKILVEGYAYAGQGDEFFASPTCTLLEFQGLRYIVDPGASEEKLSNSLKENKISPEEIAGIFLSHYHPDHFLNIRLFPHVPIYDGSMLWQSDREVPYTSYWLHEEFRVLPTPGHAPEQCSLLVDTSNLGLVCIAQDVFWWEDGKQKDATIDDLYTLHDPFASDSTALLESRKKVLETKAEWIIPGHGKMFRNPTL